MDILEILNASHKKCIARYILEALPEWFGLPESREKYIQDSADNRFFCAYIGEQPVGLCYSFLYVSKYKEEWNKERRDIKAEYSFAYVKNVNDDFCSEYGSIGIRPLWGGILRTA